MKKSLKIILFISILFLIGTNNVMAAEECVACGNIYVPIVIPNFVSEIVKIIQLSVPIIIIISGIYKYTKVVISGEDKVAAEANKMFVKNILYGIAVFLIFAIVKLIFSFLGSEGTTATSCLSCFVNGKCTKQACMQVNPSTSIDVDQYANYVETKK